MSVTSFLGAITGGNNVKIDIRINPPRIANGDIDSTKAVLIDHYPSWKLHKNPFWRVKHPSNTTSSSITPGIGPYPTPPPQSLVPSTPNYYYDPTAGSPYGTATSSSSTGTTSMGYPDDTTTKELFYAFDAAQDVEGVAIIRLQSSGSSNTVMTKGQEHMGIRIQFIGRIDTGVGGVATSVGTDGKPRYDFISLSKELMPPGALYQYETVLPFRFKNVDKEFDSYKGRNVAVRYILKVTMERKFLPPIKAEKDLWVQLLGQVPTKTEPIKMEVGIEDCLHIEFEYNKKIYHLQDVIIGKIHFLLVRIKIKHMELAVIRRETSGEGVAAAAAAAAGGGGAIPSAGLGNNNNSTNTNIYTETQTLIKYEIMDGAPIKGEVIPVRLSLRGIPADLTPTYTPEFNNRFSVKYFLNLVLVDEDDRRYFKQQEIILYRQTLGQ